MISEAKAKDKADYFFHPSIGISLGANLQQRGMGIYTPDLDQSIGNPDSTGRLRYRMTTFDFPLVLIYRFPKDILPNTRFSVSLGADLNIINETLRIWKSIDDGFHRPISITKNYKKFDIPLRAGFGLDCAVGHSSLFRIQFYGEMSNRKLYTNPSTGISSNQQLVFGIDLSTEF